MSTPRRQVVAFAGLVAVCLAAGCAKPAQTQAAAEPASASESPTPAALAEAGKPSHVFRGTVTALDPSKKTMTVDGDDVPGWMAAMTMSYPVDNTGAFGTVKVGDRIAAKVYDGSLTLFDVRVVPKG